MRFYKYLNEVKKPIAYKASNKRIIQRSGSGKFRRSTFQDIGISSSDVATGKMKCADCEHEWFPVLKTGICPECGSKKKQKIKPSIKIQKLIKRYKEINDKYPFGIDPRDKETQREAQGIFVKLRKEGII